MELTFIALEIVFGDSCVCVCVLTFTHPWNEFMVDFIEIYAWDFGGTVCRDGAEINIDLKGDIFDQTFRANI